VTSRSAARTVIPGDAGAGRHPDLRRWSHVQSRRTPPPRQARPSHLRPARSWGSGGGRSSPVLEPGGSRRHSGGSNTMPPPRRFAVVVDPSQNGSKYPNFPSCQRGVNRASGRPPRHDSPALTSDCLSAGFGLSTVGSEGLAAARGKVRIGTVLFLFCRHVDSTRRPAIDLLLADLERLPLWRSAKASIAIIVAILASSPGRPARVPRPHTAAAQRGQPARSPRRGIRAEHGLPGVPDVG
jgi:hypothetical protein